MAHSRPLLSITANPMTDRIAQHVGTGFDPETED
jgi:hypothetical protein